MVNSTAFLLGLVASSSHMFGAFAETTNDITTTIYPSPNPSTTSSKALASVLSSVLVGVDPSSVKTNSDITTTVGTTTLSDVLPTGSISNIMSSTGAPATTTTLLPAGATGAAVAQAGRPGGIAAGVGRAAAGICALVAWMA